MTPERKKWVWGSARAAGLGVLALIFFLFFVYFLRTNWPLVHTPDRFFGVFSGLFGKYTFSLENTPPLEFIQAVFILALTQGLGFLIVRICAPQLKWLEAFALAFPIGFGVSGIVLEWLTMAHGLYPLPVIGIWVLLYGIFGWLCWKKRRWDTPVLAGDMENKIVPKIRLPRRIHRIVFWWAALAIAAIITLTTFWHALFFPETYWDSLILYLGYARLTFLAHAFYYKAELQVGIGLGANYPHLFPNYGATASMFFGHWTDLHQRLAAPWAGLTTCMLVYSTALRLFRSHTVAAGAVLLYRAVPYGIAYATWASDYAMTILLVAAFLLTVSMLATRFTRGNFILFTLCPVMGMHMNYLMGILWLPWALAVLLIYINRRPGSFGFNGVLTILRHRFFWLVYVVAIIVATTWNVRNWALTGNPVYAFFPKIFTSSINVNLDVLKSAELEWFRNGDGIGRVAEVYHDLRTMQERHQESPDFQREATLGDRIAASYLFWTGYDILLGQENGPPQMGLWMQRALHLFHLTQVEPNDTYRSHGNYFVFRYRHAWKMMPLFPGLFFTTFLLAAALLALRRPRNAMRPVDLQIALITTMFVAVLMMAYMYFLADFYLYQMIPVVVCAALLGGFFLWRVERLPVARTALECFVYTTILLQGIVPGIAFGLVNFKVFRSAIIDGQYFDPMALDIFRNPGMPPELFYRIQYDGDWRMWQYLNEHLKGTNLLTHENRDYVLDPSIAIIQLDDWAMQKGYDMTDPEKIYDFLQAHNIHYYLRIPNEQKHTVNARLGMDILLKNGYLKEIFSSGEGGEKSTLYKIMPAPAHPDAFSQR